MLTWCCLLSASPGHLVIVQCVPSCPCLSIVGAFSFWIFQICLYLSWSSTRLVPCSNCMTSFAALPGHVVTWGLQIILRVCLGQVVICSTCRCSNPCPGREKGHAGSTSWLIITPLHEFWPVSAYIVRGIMCSLDVHCLYHHVHYTMYR